MMAEQMIILIFLIAGVGATLFLYLWKAKKEMEYKRDERWQLIQLKSNHTANYVNYVLIVLLAVGEAITLFSDVTVTFTFNRLLTFGTLFLALRNAIELAALFHFDKRL